MQIQLAHSDYCNCYLKVHRIVKRQQLTFEYLIAQIPSFCLVNASFVLLDPQSTCRY